MIATGGPAGQWTQDYIAPAPRAGPTTTIGPIHADPLGPWRPLAGPEFSAPDGNTHGADGAIRVVDTERNAVRRVEPDTGAVQGLPTPRSTRRST